MPQSTFHTMRLYILASCSFWIVMSLFCFLRWHNPSVSKEMLMLSLVLSFLISCVVGTFFSIPAFFLDKMGCSKIGISAILIVIHFSFFALNLSVEPRFFFYQKGTHSIGYQLVSLIHKKIFKPNLEWLDSKWDLVSVEAPYDSKYIFLFGKKSLGRDEFDALGKKTLQNQIFVIHNEDQNDLIQKAKSNVTLPLTSIAASQPQFMALYRIGFFGFFFKSMQWRYVDKSHFSFLLESANEMLLQKSKSKENIFLFDWFDEESKDQLEHVFSSLKKNPSHQIMLIYEPDHFSDFQISKMYSNQFRDQDAFFYKGIVDGKENTDLVDCRLDQKNPSRFLCILNRNELFLFEKKYQTAKKNSRTQAQGNLFFQIFSTEKKIGMRSSLRNSDPWDAFFNQFSIYKIDLTEENKTKILSNSERGKFIKENSQSIFNYISSHIIEN